MCSVATDSGLRRALLESFVPEHNLGANRAFASCGCGHRFGNARHRDHTDVVFRAEALCGADHFGGRLCGAQQFEHAFEAEELSLRICRFDNAVGYEDQAIAVVQLEALDGKPRVFDDPQGQRPCDGQRFAVQIRR